MLLKATHWPLVFTIMAYEVGQQQWSNRHIDGLFASAAAKSTTSQLRRPLTRRLTRPPMTVISAATRSETRTPQPRAALETIEAWENAVESIRAQVDMLSSLISSERDKLGLKANEAT